MSHILETKALTQNHSIPKHEHFYWAKQASVTQQILAFRINFLWVKKEIKSALSDCTCVTVEYIPLHILNTSDLRVDLFTPFFTIQIKLHTSNTLPF